MIAESCPILRNASTPGFAAGRRNSGTMSLFWTGLDLDRSWTGLDLDRLNRQHHISRMKRK